MPKYDVVGIGSPLLDLTVEVDETLLNAIELKKGEMHLVDEEKSKELLDKLSGYNIKISPGGSASNTVAGVSVLGGKSAFIGKIGKDENGRTYALKTSRDGVYGKFAMHDAMTGNAISLITPDGERTFATHLGAAIHFSKNDLSEEMIKDSKILHIEGYLLEGAATKEAAIHAMEIASQNNVKVSIDLADPGLIERNLESLKEIVRKHADIVFVNENEAFAFTGKKEDEALKEIAKMCETAIVKLGEKGSLVAHMGKFVKIEGVKTNVVNTNGAGDAYAAGILYSIANNFEIEKAGNIASAFAAKVVSRAEARVDKKDIKEF